MSISNFPPVLTIAGSDSGGGAGIQADLKTFAALKCYGASVITAITAQNTWGVYAIHPIPSEIVKAQLVAVMDDIRPKVIKVGMLYSVENVIVVAEVLRKYPTVPIIFDPVLMATAGQALNQDGILAAFRKYLFPVITLLTPNLFEAAQLSEHNVETFDEMKKAASLLLKQKLQAVLIKGGHLKSEELINLYEDRNGKQAVFKSQKIRTSHLHGTGCTLSAAIAAYLAQGFTLLSAIERAGKFVNNAIIAGKDLAIGSGNGPVNPSF